MKEPFFTTRDMSALLSLSYRAINKRIQDLGIEPVYKENGMRFFSKESYVKVANYTRRDEPIIYTPLRIETVYHIYESKMNYLNLD